MYKVVMEFLKSKKNLQEKIKDLFLLLSYYRNLLHGIKTMKIYHLIASQNNRIEQLTKSLSEQDYELIDLLLQKNVKTFLQTQKLENSLNFDKRDSSIQIGQNTIFVEKPIRGLWTTGKSTFFMPIIPNRINKIQMTFFSIAPLSVTVSFDGVSNKQIDFQKLSTRTVDFSLNSNDCVESPIEISVVTDKLWFPNVVLNTPQSIPLGICIRQLSVFSETPE
ncbi:hypothetical protein NsoK4_00435 [Nitrosopumilus sp. K4]|uniref:hypothetical protein n=1 Tax=Nitrosopumilus sp. K4 TaxID=2795383 RepID=UPI001BA514E0|nr:hypothetical protein [Nitrosopumilus sp. K4]QUC64791.1 hypothetical protein NsoK4_00435 [Nitrosopumilus sp. K4]